MKKKTQKMIFLSFFGFRFSPVARFSGSPVRFWTGSVLVVDFMEGL